MKLRSLDTTPQSEVSHNPNIKKQALLNQGDIAAITNFSRAVFPPGESAPSHAHLDMTEVFFVASGIGEIQVDNKQITLRPGTCVTVEPGEQHEVRNTGSEALVLLYFGVVTA